MNDQAQTTTTQDDGDPTAAPNVSIEALEAELKTLGNSAKDKRRKAELRTKIRGLKKQAETDAAQAAQDAKREAVEHPSFTKLDTPMAERFGDIVHLSAGIKKAEKGARESRGTLADFCLDLLESVWDQRSKNVAQDTIGFMQLILGKIGDGIARKDCRQVERAVPAYGIIANDWVPEGPLYRMAQDTARMFGEGIKPEYITTDTGAEGAKTERTSWREMRARMREATAKREREALPEATRIAVDLRSVVKAQCVQIADFAGKLDTTALSALSDLLTAIAVAEAASANLPDDARSDPVIDLLAVFNAARTKPADTKPAEAA